MPEQTEHHPDPDAVAAFINESLGGSTETKPAEQSAPIPVELKPDEVAELRRNAPGFSPEPDLTFVPTYPEHMRSGAFLSYTKALQETHVSQEEKEEYIRALGQINPDDYRVNSHVWEIGLIQRKFRMRVRSLNGYELFLIDQIVAALVMAGEKNPGSIKTVQVFSMIAMMVQTFNGSTLKCISFNPAHMSDPEKTKADTDNLMRSSREICSSYSSAQIKLMTAALQMFEAKQLKCQVAVFDESF